MKENEMIGTEATCATCGDITYVPADEDPSDTLCDICSDDETYGEDE